MGIEQGSFAHDLGDHEEDILEFSNSFRTLRHPDLTILGDIATEIEGKIVADFGSGLGGLAKSASIEERDSIIWSINPALRDMYYQVWQRETTFGKLPEAYPHVSFEKLVEAQRAHDVRVSTNFVHDLSDFPDNFFDLGIDNLAVHAYMPENPWIYRRTLSEMMRVVRPGGKVIVGDGGGRKSAQWDNPASMQRRITARMGIRHERIRAEDYPGKEITYGAVLYKPGR